MTRQNSKTPPATGKAKSPNLMMGGDEPDEHIDPDQPIGDVLAQVLAQQHDLQRRMAHMEAQQGNMNMYMPRSEIPLNRRELERVIKEDPAAWFEVLEDYRRGSVRLNKGKLLCIQNYPHIPAHVGAGLKVMGAEAPG